MRELAKQTREFPRIPPGGSKEKNCCGGSRVGCDALDLQATRPPLQLDTVERRNGNRNRRGGTMTKESQNPRV